MATIEEAKRIKNKYESALLKKKGVVGCATGYKVIGGRKSNKPAIICYVMKKKPKRELREEDIVPGELDGVPTDVVESGDIRAL
ncbi:MAG: hypothetical protein O8C66_14235 [Candidatus Methanoperedens sp.]|nr:hypothetical protein [Candidatus Methanoperedens sp.]MCZ7371658.1 hypothetical protein [Candidatus Methanoperedens sp.]